MLSIENNKLKRMRNDYLLPLRLRLESYLLSPILVERNAVAEIQCIIEPYGREYYVASIVSQKRLADDLKESLMQNNAFKEAVLHETH